MMNVAMETVKIFENPNMAGGWKANHFQVKLKYNGKEACFFYSQGLGCKFLPTVEDVLDCLRGDCSANSNGYYTWCDEMGLNEELIDSKRIYDLCVETAEKLQDLFGKDYPKFLNS